MKKLLFSSLFIGILLLLTPTIPALQQNTINYQNEPTILDNEKFPIIFHTVVQWFKFRQDRIDLLADISYDRYLIDENRNLWEYDIYHPLLYIRCVMLLLTTVYFTWLIEEVSDARSWNWDIPFY